MLGKVRAIVSTKFKVRVLSLFHDRWGTFICSACGRKVMFFNPLPLAYFDMHEKHGYKSGIVETLNFGQYSCPRCGAVDRDRLSIMFLKLFLKEVDVEKRFSVLKFGPNPIVINALNELLKDHPNYSLRTVDYFQDVVDDTANIEDMHIYKDAQFDFFVCSHVLEHVSNDRKALRELFRVLAPSGHGILMVPIDLTAEATVEDPTSTDEAANWRRFGQGDHVRRYDRVGFIERVKTAGFDIEEWDQHRFGMQQFVKNGISQQSVLYVVKKS